MLSMTTRKLPPLQHQGRKSAYVARNRAAILRAAQSVIAHQGSGSSIDLFADEAGVSVSTLYKHFENKENLITEAIASAFHQWEEDIDLVLAGIDDPMQELVAPMKLFLRLRETHPLYANMMARNFSDLPKYFWKTEEGLTAHIQELLERGLLQFDFPELRIRMMSACLTAAIGEHLTNPEATQADADAAIEVILGLLQIPQATAKKLARIPLPQLRKF